VIASPWPIRAQQPAHDFPGARLGQVVAERMSLGLAMAPISLPTQSRSSWGSFRLVAEGRGPFSTTKAHTGLARHFIRPDPTTAASATSLVRTSADSISIVPSRCPETFSTSSIRP